MHYHKTHILFALFGILAILYAANIFLTRSLSAALVDSPAIVSFAIIEPPKAECKNCFDGNNIPKTIKSAHNIKYKSSSISYDNELSQKYIETYGIKNLPAIIVSGDIKNENVLSAWKALSGTEKNGDILIENLLPYYDIKSGTVKGVINTILLKDETCQDCFDENDYMNILGRFGLTIGDTATYDIASEKGAAIVQKYAITKIPALMLSPDTSAYTGFASSWEEVGTVEQDGWFVLREVQKVNPQYKQL